MALPRKNSRIIVVDGYRYRWHGRYLGELEPVWLIVESADKPREKIQAEFGYEKLAAEYKRVGKRISRSFDRLPPYIVRQTILFALRNKWKPEVGHGVRNLGLLDDKIDFSNLTTLDPSSPLRPSNRMVDGDQ